MNVVRLLVLQSRKNDEKSCEFMHAMHANMTIFNLTCFYLYLFLTGNSDLIFIYISKTSM